MARSTSAGRSGCSRRASRTSASTCSVVRPVAQTTSGSGRGAGGVRRRHDRRHRAEQRVGVAGGERRVDGGGLDQERGEAAGLVGVGQRRHGDVAASARAGGDVARSRSGAGPNSASSGLRRRALGDAGQPDDAVAAAALGVVEHAVGGGEEGAAVVAAGGRGDAHADRDRDVEPERRPVVGGDLAAGALEGPLGLLGGRVGQQDDELVAGPAAHLVGVADAVDEQLGHRAQDGVAAGVPDRVVDRLEPVHVDDGERRGRAGRQQPVEPGLGVAPVRQVGQRVLVGLPAQLPGGPLGLQQALAAAEQLDPAGAPLVDPVQLVGEVGLQVGQRAAGVVQLGVQRAQLAERRAAQPGEAVLGGQRQRGDEVLVGGRGRRPAGAAPGRARAARRRAGRGRRWRR